MKVQGTSPVHRAWVAAVVLLVAAGCGPGDGTASGDDGSQAEQSLVAQGEQLYEEKACVSCHTTDGSSSVGPTWEGLYLSEVTLDDGSTIVADEEYLAESMLEPSVKTVEGYSPGLMESVVRPNSLAPQEVDALIEYIKSLS